MLATNGGDYQARLGELHREAALALGYEPSSGDGLRFTLDDLPLVERFFANVERYVLDNALVFRDPDPLLRYYASGPIDRLAERPKDRSHRARLLMLVKARVEAIIEQEGVFRDPKRTGCFVAHIPCGQFAEASVWSSWHPFR